MNVPFLLVGRPITVQKRGAKKGPSTVIVWNFRDLNLVISGPKLVLQEKFYIYSILDMQKIYQRTVDRKKPCFRIWILYFNQWEDSVKLSNELFLIETEACAALWASWASESCPEFVAILTGVSCFAAVGISTIFLKIFAEKFQKFWNFQFCEAMASLAALMSGVRVLRGAEVFKNGWRKSSRAEGRWCDWKFS